MLINLARKWPKCNETARANQCRPLLCRQKLYNSRRLVVACGGKWELIEGSLLLPSKILLAPQLGFLWPNSSRDSSFAFKTSWTRSNSTCQAVFSTFVLGLPSCSLPVVPGLHTVFGFFAISSPSPTLVGQVVLIVRFGPQFGQLILIHTSSVCCLGNQVIFHSGPN